MKRILTIKLILNRREANYKTIEKIAKHLNLKIGFSRSDNYEKDEFIILESWTELPKKK